MCESESDFQTSSTMTLIVYTMIDWFAILYTLKMNEWPHSKFITLTITWSRFTHIASKNDVKTMRIFVQFFNAIFLMGR